MEIGPHFKTPLKVLAWIGCFLSVVLLLTALAAPFAHHPIFWALLYLEIVLIATIRMARRQVGQPVQFRLGTLFGITAIIAILFGLFSIALR